MNTAEHIERQALRELLRLIRELTTKEEERDEHDHAYNRSHTG